MKIEINGNDDYWSFFKSISDVLEESPDEIVLRIRKEFGRGSIRTRNISASIGIASMDLCLKRDLTIAYRLPVSHFEVSYCIEGSLVLWSPENEKIHMERDAAVLVRSGEAGITGKMCFQKGKPFRCIALEFDRDAYNRRHPGIRDALWSELFQGSQDKGKSHLLIEGRLRIKTTLLDIIDSDFDRASLETLFIESRIMEILSLVACSKRDGKTRIKLSGRERDLIRQIPDMMMESWAAPVSIAVLAEKLDMNAARMKKGFKYLYDDTIYSYFKKLRLRRAAELLRNRDRSILDIALDIGYQSPSQFGAAFKKAYGVTPFEYSKYMTRF